MFDTIVVATDGSDSVRRAVALAVDVAARFEADVHAVYVLDAEAAESTPSEAREDRRDAPDDRGREALDRVADAAWTRDADLDVTLEVRAGRPADEIDAYAREVDADLVAMGTRGRHGEDRFLIGSVAEGVVRSCPVPVVTVRRLIDEDTHQATV